MQPRIRGVLGGVMLVALLAAGSPPVAGQAGKAGSIQGKIHYTGLPLPAGTVTFHTGKGGIVVVPIRPDGTYSAKGVPVGDVRVAVETESVKPKPAPGGKRPPGAGEAAKYVPIPRKYADPKTSGLTVTVKEGKQTHDIDLR